jgi:hypothetical protein
MGMQYDVKSEHLTGSGVAVSYRTRLKGAVMSPNSTAAKNAIFANNVAQNGTYNIPGSTVCTVTITNHGLSNGARIWVDFTSGSGTTDNVYVVANASANTFTVTTASLTTSGNVSVYSDVLMEVDCYNPTSFNVIVPGEGILATNGIYVGVPANVTATVFYG